MADVHRLADGVGLGLGDCQVAHVIRAASAQHVEGLLDLFEVTADVSRYTKADVFRPGRRTPVFARFSTVAGEPWRLATVTGEDLALRLLDG